MENLRGEAAQTEELYLGDAIHFFLSAKRAGGRSQRTIDDYRKKLELFQRWVASRYAGEEAVDAPYLCIGADEVESYVVYLRDERRMADSSRKKHLMYRARTTEALGSRKRDGERWWVYSPRVTTWRSRP